MRRDERKRTGARGVSNYQQETNMSTPTHDQPDLQPPLGGTEVNGLVVCKTITKDELADYLQHLHWIPAFRGIPSGIRRRFMEYKPLEFIGYLRKVGAIKKGEHFTGRVPAPDLVYVTLYIGGVWEAKFLTKTGKIRTRRSKPTVKQAG
jgi:hypothetical protein